jgi:hypothetical protein
VRLRPSEGAALLALLARSAQMAGGDGNLVLDALTAATPAAAANWAALVAAFNAAAGETYVVCASLGRLRSTACGAFWPQLQASPSLQAA